MGERLPTGDLEQHIPVLVERCVALLAPALSTPSATGSPTAVSAPSAASTSERPRVHVDATLGLGGHAEAMLAAFPQMVLVGLDRDPQALRLARTRLAPYTSRTHLVQAVSTELADILDDLGDTAIHSALFDLGVSSLQLDEVSRGFAYSRDAPLDMRMDQTSGRTAEDVVNEDSPAELIRILRVYGEEKFAPRVVAAIVRERARNRITSSARLAEIVRDAIPAATRRTGGHPAKRTFQALRIEVNGELDALRVALPAVLDRLAPGGRVVVLSYHSLEDRITKRALAEQARSSAPVDLPIEPPGSGPRLRLLTKGAELPSEAEVAANPRAASVRLRAAERIDPDADQPTRRRPRRVTALHQPGWRAGAPAGRGSPAANGAEENRGEVGEGL